MKTICVQAVLLLFLCMSCSGCSKHMAKRIVMGILEPAPLGGGASGEDEEDIEALEQAEKVVDSNSPTVAAALATPTACDPTDADGDPYDDDCPAPPAPAPTPSK